MKKLIIATFISVIFMTSCDYVDAPYIQMGANGCTITEPTFTPRTNPVRKILVEDMTGHRCGSCPRAAEKMLDLYSNYPGQIVGVSLHSELSGYFTAPLADTGKFSYDFRTALAKAIDQKFGVSAVGLPNGLVNRRKVSGNPVISHTQWANEASQILAAPPDMDIQIKPFFNASDSSLCAYVYVECLNNLSGSFKLACYLVEDEFINWQKDYAYPGENIQFYHHEHVLRAPLSTTWGTLLADGQVNIGQTFVNGYSITFDLARWNPDHCKVIAFVYNENTDEVIQAEEQKIIP